MRKFLISAVALLCVCGAQAQSEEAIPWPLEPKNEYVEYMLYLESEDIRMMGEKELSLDSARILAEVSDEFAQSEQMVTDVNALYKEVEKAWRKFVWLCNEERFQEAIKFYSADPLMVDLALSHSMIRYTFHYEVLGFIAYEALSEDEARRLMANAISLDSILLGCKYAETGDESYKEYYDESYYLLEYLYCELGDYQAVIDLIDARSQFLSVEDSSAGERGAVCIAKAEMYFAMGDAKMAYDLLVEGKALLEEELQLHGDDEELKQAIEAVDEIIEFVSQSL